MRGYWQYLNGVPIDDLSDLKGDEKSILKTWVQASINGKTPYQVAIDTEIHSYICSDLARMKKLHRRACFKAMEKRSISHKNRSSVFVSDSELLNFIKSKNKPVTAREVSQFLRNTSVYSRFEKLEKSGILKRVIVKGLNHHNT